MATETVTTGTNSSGGGRERAQPAVGVHQSFLVWNRFYHLKIATTVVLISIVLYLWHSPLLGPSGSTWLGFTLGTIAALIMVWLTWFGYRKRSYADPNKPLAAWLSAHVYYGLSLVFIATLHCAFQFGWNVHTLSYALMMLVIVSGLFGIFAYTRYPRLITANRSGATQIQMLGQIAALDGEIRQSLMGIEDAVVRAVAPATERDEIGGSVLRQLSARYPTCPTAAALAAVQRAVHELPAERAADVRGILVLLTRKAELLQRVRRDIQFKALMDIWLYVHVPMTFACLAALVAHIIAVFFYW
jgi:hypothetical protein